MNKIIVIIAAIVILLGGLFFLKEKNVTRTSNKLQVTASFYPLYFFAQEIGKDKVSVRNITASGSEPHDYDLTAQDIARIEKGNMLVLNGAVESWGEKIKNNLRGSDVKIVVAGESLFTQKLDPHVWLDPILAKKEAHAIAQGLVSIDSANKAYYEENEKALNDKLDKWDKLYKQGLSNCEQRNIVTSHAAFGYLAARYDLDQIPISGLSPDAEPSVKQFIDTAKFAKKNNVEYIFFESLVSPKLADTIANEIGAKTLVLDPIEGISDDDKKLGKNYFTIMEDNLTNLKKALQCSK